MFDRNIQSFHDAQTLDVKTISRYIDEFSAKYLKSSLNPDFPLRVRERNIPVLPVTCAGIGGSERKFKSREEVLQCERMKANLILKNVDGLAVDAATLQYILHMKKSITEKLEKDKKDIKFLESVLKTEQILENKSGDD